jgi:hypothetical protein
MIFAGVTPAKIFEETESRIGRGKESGKDAEFVDSLLAFRFGSDRFFCRQKSPGAIPGFFVCRKKNNRVCAWPQNV